MRNWKTDTVKELGVLGKAPGTVRVEVTIMVGPNNTRLKFTLPKEDMEYLKGIAKLQHRSLSELVMHYVITGIDKDLRRESTKEKVTRIIGSTK